MTGTLREIALANFQTALSQAIDLIGLEGEDLDRLLFPLWTRALHDTLVQISACPCVNETGACFMDWSEARQRTCFASDHSLSYARLQRAFEQGCALALAALSAPPDAGTH